MKDASLVLFLFFWFGHHHIIQGIRADYEHVTCGSSVKLMNEMNRARLFSSRRVHYRSGSGQQVVTALIKASEPGCLWQITGSMDEPCKRGMPVKCDQVIRLKHAKSGRNLHSHLIKSPLSKNPEVSAFGERGVGDTGDHWRIICSGKYWTRRQKVRFIHEDTARLLYVSARLHHLRGIEFHREVSTKTRWSEHTLWTAIDGVYLPTNSHSRRKTADGRHDEL